MKKVKIILDKYKYVKSYCTIGDIPNSIEIEIDDDFEISKIKDYQFIEDKLVLNQKPQKPDHMIEPIYNGSKWLESADADTISKATNHRYIQELDLAGKAHAEFMFGIISEVEFREVESYIKEMHKLTKSKGLIYRIPRPKVFERYEQRGDK